MVKSSSHFKPAPFFLEPKAERLREPVLVAGEIAEQRSGDEHVVEMRHQEGCIVHQIRHYREQNAGNAAKDKRYDKAKRKQHRHGKFYPAAIHRE